MRTRSFTRCMMLISFAVVMLGALALNIGVANAVQSPPGCSSNDFVLNISKSPVSQVHVGDTITYTVSAGNPQDAGNTGCDVSGITITGTDPHGNTTTLQTATDYPIGTATGVIGTFTYVASAADAVSGILTASTHATGILNDLVGVDDPLAITKTVSNNLLIPSIAVTKTCTDVTFGQAIPFSGTVTNTGNTTLTGVTCTDDKTGALTVPSLLAASGSATFSGSYTPTTSPSTNTVTCSGTDALGLTVTATASATCTVTCSPSITVTKTCTDGLCGPIAFNGTVTNGPIPLTNVSCTDDKTGALSVPTSLAASGSATFSGSYTPTTSPSTNTVTCSGTAPAICGGGTVSNTASATCNESCTPNLSLTKTCTDAAFGQPIQFSATLTNTGTDTMNSITCSDDPVTALSGVPTTLAPGASATITGSYVPTASPSTDTITCSGTGAFTQTTITKTASATCNVTCNPSITVTKTCTDGTCGPIAFSGSVTNGPIPLTNVSCTDSKTGALSVPTSLAASGSATFSGSYTPTTSPSTNTVTCSGTAPAICGGGTVSNTASATCNESCTPNLSLTKTCTPPSGSGQPIQFSATLTNTGTDTMNNITCSDDPVTTLSDVPTTLAPGASATITGSYVPTTNPSTDTITCSGTGLFTQTTITKTASATCGFEVAAACRMTGGHNNSLGSIDATFVGNGKSYTTGGQIGAPSARGCCDFPQKGQCVSNSPITDTCTTGTCCSGGLNGGMDCTSNDDCPPNTGAGATCPWGDWEHNHHNGPDDLYVSSAGTQGIQSGSFSFHSGTAAAPDSAFIHNIICADPGWCVQARPAPDKQIFWEGTGVFHSTTNGTQKLPTPLPNFKACATQPQPWSNKTQGTISYYRAHVGDFGEPAGTKQNQPPATASCTWNNFCAASDVTPVLTPGSPTPPGYNANGPFGGVSIWDCNLSEGACFFSPAPVDQKFTDLHPLCLAQDCGCLTGGDSSCQPSGGVPKAGCPDWYEIEIHCGVAPSALAGMSAADAFEFLKTQPIAYKVAHFITAGNFQLHPQVGSSCNPSCGNGICEPGVPEAATGETCANCPADCGTCQ